MNDLIRSISFWFWDYSMLAAGLLAVVCVLSLLVKQPARRMAVHWSAAVGLFLLAGLCAIPGWSVVHMLAAVDEVPPAWTEELEPQFGPAIQSVELTEPLSIVEPTDTPNPKKFTDTTTDMAASEVVVVDYGILATYIVAAGSILVLVWLLIGHWQVRRLLAQSEPAPHELTELLKQLAPVGRWVPRLAVAEKLPVAVAVGLWRPTILLPLSFVAKTAPESMRTVLAHELSHIRHRDLWLLSLLRGLMLVLWWNPLYWLWRRGVRLDQETLADASAAEVTNRTDYAEQLVSWARETASGGGRMPVAASVGLWESPSQLKRRIAILLDEKLTVLRACSRRWRLGSAFLLLVLAMGLSLFTLQPREIVLAETKLKEKVEKETEQLSKKFPTGARVEVIAIGSHDEEPQRWWDAKGTTIQDMQLDWQKGNSSVSGPHPRWRRVIVRVLDLPKGGRVRWHIDGATASGGAIINNQAHGSDGYYSRYFNIADTLKSFGLRVGIAADNWETISSSKGRTATGTNNGDSLIYSEITPTRLGSEITVTHNIFDRDYRVVAIDKQGKCHPQSGSGGMSAGKIVQSRASFLDLNPQKIDRVEFQTRPYEWKKFENLPVWPDVRSEALSRLKNKQQPNSIVGVCLDMQGQPIADIEVTMYERTFQNASPKAKPIATAMSDKKGAFRFDKVVDIPKVFPQGIPDEDALGQESLHYMLIGRASGFTSMMHSSSTASQTARLGANVAWVLQPAKAVRGRVTDRSGQPVAGARVAVGMIATQSRHAVNYHSAITDAQGNYVVDDVAAYDYQEAKKQRIPSMPADHAFPPEVLLVTHPDYATRRVSLRQIPSTVDVKLERGAMIKGRLTLPLGEEMLPNEAASAFVIIERARPRDDKNATDKPFVHQSERTKATEDGYFEFRGLPAGKYHMKAFAKGWLGIPVENIEVGTGEKRSSIVLPLSRGVPIKMQLVDIDTGHPWKFEQPTQGFLSVIERSRNPQGMSTYQFGDQRLLLSEEGRLEKRVLPGKYTFLIHIPEVEPRQDLVTANPESERTDRIYTVIANEPLEIEMPVRMQKQPPPSEMELSFVLMNIEPSDDDDSEAFKAVDTFAPETPPADQATNDNLQELVDSYQQIFDKLEALNKLGSVGGETHKLLLAKYHLLTARAQLLNHKKELNKALQQRKAASESAQEYVAALEAVYDAGRAPLAELLEAQQLLLEARQNLLLAKRELVKSSQATPDLDDENEEKKSTWTPPKDPDPVAIRKEAAEDTRAGEVP